MRYRKLDLNGDAVFGHSAQDFLADSPECVAQAIRTRLLLLRGEWFLDDSEGTPYATEILNKSNQITRDRAIKARILGTPNVTEITDYSSALNERDLFVSATVSTAFGQTTVTTTL